MPTLSKLCSALSAAALLLALAPPPAAAAPPPERAAAERHAADAGGPGLVSRLADLAAGLFERIFGAAGGGPEPSAPAAGDDGGSEGDTGPSVNPDG